MIFGLLTSAALTPEILPWRLRFLFCLSLERLTLWKQLVLSRGGLSFSIHALGGFAEIILKCQILLLVVQSMRPFLCFSSLWVAVSLSMLASLSEPHEGLLKLFPLVDLVFP